MTRLLHNMGFPLKFLLLLSIAVVCTLTVFAHCQLTNDLSTSWMEERLFDRARCKANCLRLFSDPEEQKALR
ncbi:unnamed protein product, partial [Schistosoma turkestanicum]